MSADFSLEVIRWDFRVGFAASMITAGRFAAPSSSCNGRIGE